MLFHHRTQGFVFKKEDKSDADRVFSVFSLDFGRLEITAKGIRKIESKLRGGIEIFSLSEIEFVEGKHQKTLTDAVFIEKFKNISENQDKFKTALKIGDVLDNFILGQEEDEPVFNLLLSTFNKLNEPEASPQKIQLVYYYFVWNFLSILGYKPEIQKCVNCHLQLNPEELFFSFAERGILCKNCFSLDKKADKIDPNVVKVIRLIFNSDWQTISKLKVESSLENSLKEVLDGYSKMF